MTDAHDEERPHDATELEDWEEEPRSGVLQTLWFRLLLVLVVVGGAAVASAPYLLRSSPPVPEPTARAAPPAPASAPAGPVAATTPGATIASGPAGAPSSQTTPATVPTPVTPLSVAATAAPSTERPAAATERITPPTERATPTERTAPASERKPVTERKTVSAERSTPATERRTPAVQAPPRTVAPAAAPTARSAATSLPPPAAAPTRTRAEPSPKSPDLATRARGPVENASADRVIGGEHGDHWVQVGAFRDPAMARRLAARLRAQHFRVQEMAGTAGPAARSTGAEEGAQYTVVVPTATPAEAVSRLRALGVTAESATEGAVVTPTLPLRDAVALARTITSDGLRVQVRRVSASGAAASTAPGADALHRVRVGAFPDRGSALVAVRALEEQGYRPFITREAR